ETMPPSCSPGLAAAVVGDRRVGCRGAGIGLRAGRYPDGYLSGHAPWRKKCAANARPVRDHSSIERLGTTLDSVALCPSETFNRVARGTVLATNPAVEAELINEIEQKRIVDLAKAWLIAPRNA